MKVKRWRCLIDEELKIFLEDYNWKPYFWISVGFLLDEDFWRNFTKRSKAMKKKWCMIWAIKYTLRRLHDVASLDHTVTILYFVSITTSNSTPWHGISLPRRGWCSTHFLKNGSLVHFDPTHLYSQEESSEVLFPALIREV